MGILTVLSLVLAYGSTAEGSTILVTPIAFAANQQVQCVVTNFDTKPAVITAQMFSQVPALLTPYFDSCDGVPIPSGASCSINVYPVEVYALCRVVSSSSKVKAALEVIDIDTGKLTIMFPAAKP